MLARWFGVASVFALILSGGCGGRASEDSMQAAGGAGAAGLASSVAGGGAADRSLGAAAGATPEVDGGTVAYCSGASALGCDFSAADRPDLPPEQRFGAVAQWQDFPYPLCGNATFEVDHNGCVTAAADATQSNFSVSALKYLQPFAWSCASGQRVVLDISCTIR